MSPGKTRMTLVRDLPGPFCVICEECKVFHFLDRQELMARYGAEIDARDAITHAARDIVGCDRTAPDTPVFRRCRMTGHHTREQKDTLAKISPPLQPTPRDIRDWEMIVAVCLACRHVSEVRRWVASKAIGPDTPLVLLCKRLRCKGCGALGQVQVSIVRLARGPR